MSSQRATLSETFAGFTAGEQCEDCYEIVDPDRLVDGRCPGCRHGARECVSCGELVAPELLDDNTECPGCAAGVRP